MAHLLSAERRAVLNDSKGVGLLELALFSVVLVSALAGLISMNYIAISLIAIAVLSTWLRGVGLRGLGMGRLSKPGSTLGLGALLGGALFLFNTYVTERAIVWLGGSAPDLGSFQGLEGNVGFLLLMLALVWTFAAFGEEIAFRGYLITRIAGLLGGQKGAWVVALLVSGVVFGIPHLYQGTGGALSTGIGGLLYGAIFLLGRRNLWLPIMAHGMEDTIGVAALFLGWSA